MITVSGIKLRVQGGAREGPEGGTAPLGPPSDPPMALPTAKEFKSLVLTEDR